LELPSDFTKGETLKDQVRDLIDSLAQLTVFNHDATTEAISGVC
jgi:hypothetical protein